jgi:hypothetical protein
MELFGTVFYAFIRLLECADLVELRLQGIRGTYNSSDW